MNKKYIYWSTAILLALISFIYKLYISGDMEGIKASIVRSSAYLTDEKEITKTSVSNSPLSAPIDTLYVSEPLSAESSLPPPTIDIYICGAVSTSGVYELPRGSILNEAINLAGGMTAEAASDQINLVYQLDHNITVYIPTQAEINSGTYVTNMNESGIIIGVLGNNELTSEVSDTTAPSGIQLINLNTASKTELTSLPGIGDVTAERIIAYRQSTPFTCKEDIMNVSGIGESKYEQIKEFIEV